MHQTCHEWFYDNFNNKFLLNFLVKIVIKTCIKFDVISKQKGSFIFFPNEALKSKNTKNPY